MPCLPEELLPEDGTALAMNLQNATQEPDRRKSLSTRQQSARDEGSHLTRNGTKPAMSF